MKNKDIITNTYFDTISITDKHQLINQQTNKLSEHHTDDKFLVLNNELGYFNKLTNFIVGNNSSMLFTDINGEIVLPSIREVKANPKKFFMLYPIPCLNQKCVNYSLELEIEKNMFGKLKRTEEIVDLTFELGLETGKKFAMYKEYDNQPLTPFETAINGCSDDKYFWPNKNLIVNSNLKFSLGVLIGYISYIDEYFDYNQGYCIHENDNVYIFATILNWLGANYNILNIKKQTNGSMVVNKAIAFKLPSIYENILKEVLPTELEGYLKLVKRTEWLLTPKKVIRKFQTSSYNSNKNKIYNHPLNLNVLEKGLLIIPATSFKFILQNTDEPIYDFTMPRADATNFALPFTPLMKNSDGDILTLSTVFSEEALEDAEAFAPSSKDWFRNLNNGNVNTYIKDDALLGLYAMTKYL